MAKLPRVTNKRFGSDIELDNIGQFGSAAAGEKTNTKDVAEIQALEAWRQGWTKATMSQNKYPTMQERNGLDYVMSYQIDYMLKEGLPEYDSQTEYSKGAIAKRIEEDGVTLFESQIDENIGQDLDTSNAWRKLLLDKNVLRTSQITNCLLEVPQRINLTLENNTLTLHAGSVVIVPYGATDRTSEFPIGSTFINDNFKVYDTQFANGKFFVWAEVQSDISLSTFGSGSDDKNILSINLARNNFMFAPKNRTESGSDNTSTTSYVYYDTTDNWIYHRGTTSGDWNSTEINSFIILIFGRTSGIMHTIHQVFNGFGYIGNTIWVDKGVKCLISNGRNKDRTLNNIEYTTSTIGIISSQVGNFNDYIWLRIHSNPISIGVIKEERYHDSENNYYVKDGENVQYCVVGKMVVDETLGITEFNVKQPFRAVDYNDYMQGVGSTKAYITETYKNGTSWYRVWSDGWCEQGGIATGGTSDSGASITLIKAYKDTNYTLIPAGVDRRTNNFQNPAAQIVKIRNVTTTGFYASTSWTATGSYGWEAYPFSWYACGYIS